MKIKLESLLQELGSPGKYQVCIFLLLALNYFPVVFNHIVMAFIGRPPQYECYNSSYEDPTYMVNLSSTTNYSIWQNEKTEYGKCSTKYFTSDSTNESEVFTCDSSPNGKWRYVGKESSIASEWDLVCSNAYLSRLATTIYFIGVMVGGLIFGYLADKFGRKKIMLVTLFTPVAIGVLTALVKSYYLFVGLRFLQGIFIQGLQTTTYVMVMELFLPQYRGTAGAVLECFWGVTVIMMAGIAYLLQDWRNIQLAISVPSALALTYIWLVPETLRWLMIKDKIDQAQKIVKKITKFNNLSFPARTMDELQIQIEAKDNEPGRQYMFYDLLRTPILRKHSLILFYLWFSVCVGYYGMTFKIAGLAGNHYLTFFISGCVDLVAFIMVIYLIQRFGRRIPLLLFFVIGSVSCIVAGSIPIALAGASGMAEKVFAIIGKFGMAGVFSIIFVYSSELYPTVIRSIGMGTCAFWARLGGVVAPQILVLGDFTHKSVSVIIFGVISLIASLLVLFLPETSNRKLPDTIEDAENIDAFKGGNGSEEEPVEL
ncbi:solute carrier family 22 member 3-like [Mytilus trossulus]|uniref:solute carrier family 22 member 3-like n=1 Tax=Mytilus trossulus TaxID=6551 RepID=UPI0030047EE5